MAVLKKEFSIKHYMAEYYVEESQEGLRLDQFLKEYLPSFSREQIKSNIKNKNVIIIGRPGNHKPNTTLHYKDKIRFTIHEDGHEDEYWRNELLKINRVPDVIFEDENIIICLKPAFMAAHPTGRHLFNCATVYFEHIHKKTVHSIHRLDRETSGVILLGKNPHYANILTSLFEENRVKKCYFLIGIKIDQNIKDKLIANERLGSVKTGLERVYINNFPPESTSGKHAQTKFIKLWEDDTYILSLALPKTGRQHQIRVHAMVHGFPLLGDKLYLGSFKMFQRFKDNIAEPSDFDLMQIPRHALHAIALNFEYLGVNKTYQSKLPEDLQTWMNNHLTIDQTELNKKIKEVLEIEFKSYEHNK